MHKDILSQSQVKLLPLVKQFSPKFYLVGGTALALQYGHRRSLDFNLFTPDKFENQAIIKKIRRCFPIDIIHINQSEQLTLVVNGVKLTFYQFEYPIFHTEKFNEYITMPDDLSIAAMKAFALGQRAKWKDYIDLYFVFKKHNLQNIVDKSREYFTEGEFNEKLFRGQLNFHKDIDYTEQVDWMPGSETPQEEILAALSQISLS